ncbi:hypothetical protein [Streptomyces sp. NRRL F-5123]|uniref:hypothetical protein n=1 Tax=Streptomyces sp. NRRL F-5123 TaxID=1463856 RepID=UPI000ADC42CB|nr:hypothetical protein [Streptomyces sp. NRRL F-5123]
MPRTAPERSTNRAPTRSRGAEPAADVRGRAPGWVAFSTDEGRAGAKSASALTVTVRAADGTILASQSKSTGD